MNGKPEDTAPAELYYNEEVSQKYHSNTRWATPPLIL
jgi:hypothetical protein